ncbi:MAG: Nif3-like dinuclear metal center hexameric protein [Lentisphaerae bacterium GWF2_52_8]|nr:MAG: Nif3-like dinuclear metal center hexameric protein [Lentisphaerae bacterium GWF2_52_8]
MTQLSKLSAYLDKMLRLDKFPRDPSKNGLQVEGVETVSKAVFAVDASAALFEKAAELDADFIFVHHGMIWGDGLQNLRGHTARRLRTLFSNGISLYAAHLPLDAHPRLGHNALLAKIAGIKKWTFFGEYAGALIGACGTLPGSSTPSALAKKFTASIGGKHKIFGNASQKIRRIGIISGGAAAEVTDAVKLGLDCFVTGEAGHSDYNLLIESGLPVIALGHYASETPGIHAVMAEIRKNFKIPCEFVDLPTGL